VDHDRRAGSKDGAVPGWDLRRDNFTGERAISSHGGKMSVGKRGAAPNADVSLFLELGFDQIAQRVVD
jgi:hypothetical protein